MEDAHLFQEAFFEEVSTQLRRSDDDGGSQRRESENDGEKFLDLALALQKAVVRVSRNVDGRRKAPYHWAAFMLQGYWNALPISSFRKR